MESIKELLPVGHTFISKSDSNTSSMDINIQYTDAVDLGDIIVEFREYLLGCGFNINSINEYIEEF